MVGKLIQIESATISEATASVTFTGIDSNDVYMLAFSGLFVDTDGGTVRFRVTTGGTADSDSEYDRAHKVPRTSASFANVNTTGGTSWGYNELGTAGNEQANGIMYLYQFNNSSVFSHYSLETVERISSGEMQSIMGGGVHTVAEANDGIQIFVDGGNFSSGTLTLYKVI